MKSRRREPMALMGDATLIELTYICIPEVIIVVGKNNRGKKILPAIPDGLRSVRLIGALAVLNQCRSKTNIIFQKSQRRYHLINRMGLKIILVFRANCLKRDLLPQNCRYTCCPSID